MRLSACRFVTLVASLLIQGCGAFSELELAEPYAGAETQHSISQSLAPGSRDRALAIQEAWPVSWKNLRRLLLEGRVDTTMPPIPHGRDSQVPSWFGRMAPRGEGGSQLVHAQAVLDNASANQRAVRVSSWTWREGLKLCWPAPVATERVYFPVGRVEGGNCLADITVDGEGWFVSSQLHDLALSPRDWVRAMYGTGWAVDGWRERAGGIYLLISPISGA